MGRKPKQGLGQKYKAPTRGIREPMLRWEYGVRIQGYWLGTLRIGYVMELLRLYPKRKEPRRFAWVLDWPRFEAAKGDARTAGEGRRAVEEAYRNILRGMADAEALREVR